MRRNAEEKLTLRHMGQKNKLHQCVRVEFGHKEVYFVCLDLDYDGINPQWDIYSTFS